MPPEVDSRRKGNREYNLNVMRHKTSISHMVLLLTFVLAGCGLSPVETTVPTTTVLPTETTTASTPAVTPEPVRELILWVSPDLAPDPENPAGSILAARLDAFLETHPDVSFSIRIKAAEGSSGLLETLLSANEAAPGALPDLLTLDQEALSLAAAEGMLLPLDEWVEAPNEDWYDFAENGIRINGVEFGLPFSAEAVVFAYRTARYANPPLTWAQLLDENKLFCWPAADPQSSLTFDIYRHLGGDFIDEDNQPILEAGALAEILTFFTTAQASQLLPASVASAASPEDCWNALSVDDVSAGVVPLQHVLLQMGTSLAAVPIPTSRDGGLSPVSTWSWAITNQRPERQELAAELAQWLSDPAFVGAWTQALGYLPASAAALDTWEDSRQLATASGLVTLATVQPSRAFLEPYRDTIHTAMESVLAGDLTPSAAASAAAVSMRE